MSPNRQTNVLPFDLELETIGFYPDQVKAYLQATFTDPKKVEDVQSYLQAHQLIQGLVRVPIQLDALCYTWDNFYGKALSQTMTAIYKTIEESLWKKDILRLGKETDKLVTKEEIKNAKMDKIEYLVHSEVSFLEGLAFTGLRNDVINFEPEHQEAIFKVLKPFDKSISLSRMLPQLSFLRTSDPSSEHHSREYHFLHLTFQEYFAARYFVRQWKAEQHLGLQLSKVECNEIEPATFLQEYKYDPRYDIFWRFVAGLLDADGEALGFFQEIEKEPRDLLGPTHQCLVMHCLSEVERKETTFTELRTKLEKQLERWLLFECDFTKNCSLASEMECPEQVLVNALKQASEDARLTLLEGLHSRAVVPSSVIDVAIPWLEDCASLGLYITILPILRHQHKALRDTILQGIAAKLEHEDWKVREAAIKVLQGLADLTKEILQSIAAQLEHRHWNVRRGAIKALQGQADLTKEILQSIAAQLEHRHWNVRRGAIKALQGQADLTKEILQSIAAQLEHEEAYVREAAIKALQGRADLTKEILQSIAAQLEHEEAAIEALLNQAALSSEVLGPHVKPLYKALLQKSFKEHLYWYASDKAFIAVGLRHISLNCEEKYRPGKKIWEIRNDLSVPLSTS